MYAIRSYYELLRLKNAGADTVILVANAAPGAQVMKSLGRMGWNVPVVSHWGISGGRFPELAGNMAEKVDFVQTYSFFGNLSPTGHRITSYNVCYTKLLRVRPDRSSPGFSDSG